jgi:hypothetical protein
LLEERHGRTRVLDCSPESNKPLAHFLLHEVACVGCYEDVASVVEVAPEGKNVALAVAPLGLDVAGIVVRAYPIQTLLHAEGVGWEQSLMHLFIEL